ncbi:17-beta-hydroxysteroid dehydrogenase 13-like isoform X2 [Rhodnius prolixus]
MFLAGLESIIKFFVPPYEKTLAGEIILVTGTGHGIGRELVLQLASEGCTLVCWDVNEEGNAETRKLLKEKGLGNKCHFYTCDVTSREDILNLAQKVGQEIGDVTIVINNAGIMHCKPLHQQSNEVIEKIFNVNVFSHFWVLEAFLPKMRERNSGHIVAVCSMCGIIGLPYAVPYSASKFAVRGLMEALSEEYRKCEETSAIKFTTVYPIMVNTGLAKKPKNRFPSLINILQPEHVAAEIIKATKRESYEIALPSFMLTFDRITRLMPRKAIQYAKDFLDTGVEPE